MPECFGEPVVTNSCAFHLCARGCGCVVHPAFPAPSSTWRDNVLEKPGREIAAGGMIHASSLRTQGPISTELDEERRDWPAMLNGKAAAFGSPLPRGRPDLQRRQHRIADIGGAVLAAELHRLDPLG